MKHSGMPAKISIMFSPCPREVIATEPRHHVTYSAFQGPETNRRCSPRRNSPKIAHGLVVRDGTDRSNLNIGVFDFVHV